MQMAISLFGEEKAKNLSEAQLRQLERQLGNIDAIKLPDLPELQAEELGESAVAGMQTDPVMRNKQLAALAEIQSLIDSGGMDLQSKATLVEALNAADAQQRRARAGVANDMAQRGQLDGGARLMMDLDAAQAGSNNARNASIQAAADASARRIQAIRDASALTGNLREMDWREKETSARAKDLREERNANERSKTALYNAGLPQQAFTNAMSKATGQIAPGNNLAMALGSQATSTQQLYSGLGQAAYQGFKGANAGGSNAPSQQPQSTTSQPPPATYEYQQPQRGGPQDITDPDDK